jgi:hypothetical protein
LLESFVQAKPQCNVTNIDDCNQGTLKYILLYKIGAQRRICCKISIFDPSKTPAKLLKMQKSICFSLK